MGLGVGVGLLRDLGYWERGRVGGLKLLGAGEWVWGLCGGCRGLICVGWEGGLEGVVQV